MTTLNKVFKNEFEGGELEKSQSLEPNVDTFTADSSDYFLSVNVKVFLKFEKIDVQNVHWKQAFYRVKSRIYA